jgi:CheY-like chemotaxis protein
VPQTLLLADDSVTIQRVIELTFADEDIDVVAVSDGDQAIAHMDAEPPDILLVDVGMPGKSGYEVAAYVKQSPKLAHIPVVLLTGAFEPVDEARATAAGCDGVLAKPFEPHMIIGRVKELLGRLTRSAELPDDVFKAPQAPETEVWPAFAPQAADAGGVGAKKIDDYFDQLDAAFTSLSNKPVADAAPIRAAAPVPVDVDWFGLKPAAPPADTGDVSLLEEDGQPLWPHDVADDSIAAPKEVPEPPPPPAAVYDTTAAAVVSDTPPAAVYNPAPPPVPPSLPPLADAFADLLEAEQGEPQPRARPAWPSGAGAGPAVTDDLVDRVSRRVLEQLTDRADRAVRDAVNEKVAAIAERLIREEIERIKASIT